MENPVVTPKPFLISVPDLDRFIEQAMQLFPRCWVVFVHTVSPIGGINDIAIQVAAFTPLAPGYAPLAIVHTREVGQFYPHERDNAAVAKEQAMTEIRQKLEGAGMIVEIGMLTDKPLIGDE